LDKKELKQKFEDLCDDDSNLVKVFIIERNSDSYSHQIHNILKTYCTHVFPGQPIGHLRGSMQDTLNMSNLNHLEGDFTRYMQLYFDISGVPLDQIPTTFRNIQKQIYFIVQSIEKFSFEKFEVYYKYWTDLKPIKPVFLFFHVKKNSLREDITSLSNFHFCRYNDDKEVDGDDFMNLFSGPNLSSRQNELCKCEPMSFAEAVKKLEECEKEN